MITITTTAPAVWRQEDLLELARTIWPDVQGCNDVDGDVTVYLPDGTDVEPGDEAAWDALVAAYEPAPPPREALLAALDLLDDAETWEDARPHVTAVGRAVADLLPS